VSVSDPGVLIFIVLAIVALAVFGYRALHWDAGRIREADQKFKETHRE